MANNGIKKVFATELDYVSDTDLEGVGVLRFEGNKVYKYVKILNTTATVAGASGDLTCYTAAGGYTLHTVCIDKTDADTVVVGAGILAGTVVGLLTVAYYGYIQLTGPATMNTDLAGAPADGDPLSAAGADKVLTQILDTTASTALVMCAIVEDDSDDEIICCFPF